MVSTSSYISNLVGVWREGLEGKGECDGNVERGEGVGE